MVFPVPGGPRRTAERALPPPERGADEEGELLDLGVAVVEVLRDERELENVRVPEESLVATEKTGTCHTSVWRRGYC